jgi:hypothetical protein
MHVDHKDRQIGNMRIEHFDIPDTEEEQLRTLIHYGERAPYPGSYVRLVEQDGDGPNDWKVWMSDTQAELVDHLSMMRRVADPECRSVLINGLGIGAVLEGVRSFDHVARIDVVESDRTVIQLAAPHFVLDERISIWQDDAYTKTWPNRIRWDAAWHDIWPEISTGNLKGMFSLYRKYRGRVGWQGFWCHQEAVRQWEKERLLLTMVKDNEGGWPRADHPLYRVYQEWRDDGRYVYRIPKEDDSESQGSNLGQGQA